jgi:hypothetical protein
MREAGAIGEIGAIGELGYLGYLGVIGELGELGNLGNLGELASFAIFGGKRKGTIILFSAHSVKRYNTFKCCSLKKRTKGQKDRGVFPFFTVCLNLPFMSVAVPLAVPFLTMVAPMAASLSGDDVSVPLLRLHCARSTP